MARGRKPVLTKSVSDDWETELGWKARYYTVQKGLLRGKQVGGFRIKNVEDESDSFLKWLDTQSNLSDAIRYLIEKEILTSGINDLAEHIPSKRKLETMDIPSLPSKKPSAPIILENLIQEPDEVPAKLGLEEEIEKRAEVKIEEDKALAESEADALARNEEIEKKLKKWNIDLDDEFDDKLFD